MQRTYTHAHATYTCFSTYRSYRHAAYRQFIWWTFNIRLGRRVRYIHERLRHLGRYPSNGTQVTTETSDRYYNMSYLRMLVEKHDKTYLMWVFWGQTMKTNNLWALIITIHTPLGTAVRHSLYAHNGFLRPVT